MPDENGPHKLHKGVKPGKSNPRLQHEVKSIPFLSLHTSPSSD